MGRILVEGLFALDAAKLLDILSYRFGLGAWGFEPLVLPEQIQSTNLSLQLAGS